MKEKNREKNRKKGELRTLAEEEKSTENGTCASPKTLLSEKTSCLNL
ncbi:hypothetical protein LEP1GSC036_2248 [Leptospira weilii str. 2006001853]|uniref:Uncharacterized protein n=1 Tax=Leptospira weilii str. 2006001853 TaxID=1001589 RepID=A0A828YXZ6_9LEPT|nr:hypothetical protein LEP1GSC036_2248 [Leptospira weilii str. 2006001853]